MHGGPPTRRTCSYTTSWDSPKHVAGTALDGLQQYELRHYFASVVIAAGASFSETANYLGNSEGEVRRTYAHLVRERADEIRRAASKIITPG